MSQLIKMANNKKYFFTLVFLSITLCLTFLYSFYKNHNLQALINACIVMLFIFLYIFLKDKELITSITLIVFSFVNLLIDPASGYGAILIYSLVCIYHKTWINFLGVSSLLLSLISIIVHKYPLEKAIILIVAGILAYTTIKNANTYKLTRTKLDLTEDEIMILNELQKVKLQKSVTCFSKNIVSKKLNEAVTRNHLSSIGELTYCYKLQK